MDDDLLDEYIDDYQEILKEIKSNMETFHLKYISKLQVSEKETLERQDFISSIKEHYTYILDDDKSIQLFYNLNQTSSMFMSAYNLLGEHKDHYIFALLFIICKIERPTHLHLLRERAVQKGITLDVVYQIEEYVLNKHRFKIYLETPQDFAKKLVNIVYEAWKKILENTGNYSIVSNKSASNTNFLDFSNENSVKNEIMKEFSEYFSDVFSQFNVYRLYNDFIWTIVLLQYVFVKGSKQKEGEILRKFIYKLVVNDEKTQKSLFDCFELIMKTENEDENEDENEEMDDVSVTSKTNDNTTMTMTMTMTNIISIRNHHGNSQCINRITNDLENEMMRFETPIINRRFEDIRLGGDSATTEKIFKIIHNEITDNEERKEKNFNLLEKFNHSAEVDGHLHYRYNQNQNQNHQQGSNFKVRKESFFNTNQNNNISYTERKDLKISSFMSSSYVKDENLIEIDNENEGNVSIKSISSINKTPRMRLKRREMSILDIMKNKSDLNIKKMSSGRKIHGKDCGFNDDYSFNVRRSTKKIKKKMNK